MARSPERVREAALHGPARHGPRLRRGVAATEALLALPLVLLLALSALQFALVLQARHALAQALHEGARAGSTAHARRDAIEAGLARGLVGWLHGSSGEAELLLNVQRVRAEIAVGERHGWIVWSQHSPHAASFEDWAEPARDADGALLPGVREIPNDHLMAAAVQRVPRSGTAGAVDGAPVGAASGQTLADANLLVLELRWGVPLRVPLIGRLASGWMRVRDGCPAAGRGGAAPPPEPSTVGRLDLGRETSAAAAQPWRCAFLSGPDAAGLDRPRWPIRVSAAVRMQTPGRETGSLTGRGPARPGATTVPGGSFASPVGIASAPVEAQALGATSAAASTGTASGTSTPVAGTAELPAGGTPERAAGFLAFGADRSPPQRLAQVPGACFGP